MAGYSGTPLAKKLGIQAGMRILIVDPPRPYPELVPDLPAPLEFVRPGSPEVDFIHAFYTRLDFLRSEILDLKASLTPRGMLWISRPKPSSGIPTDLSETLVREIGLASGLVDVKVCAVDEEWSALKFVYRLIDRPKIG